MLDTITIGNGDIYSVLEVRKEKYQVAKLGTIDRHLKGINLPTWLVNYTRYYVRAKSDAEDFERTFVLNSREAHEMLGIEWTPEADGESGDDDLVCVPGDFYAN